MKKFLSFAAFALLMGTTTLSFSACGGDDDDDDADVTKTETDAAVLAGICPDSNHPHAIDMGEAGVWACCNVGANKPEEYGSYFAWGETEPKSDYSWASYDYWTDSNGDGDVQDSELADIGSDIGGKSAYDAATKNWGSNWRMPSLEQTVELGMSDDWTQLNGINGMMFTAPNGNKIFLPAAGDRAYTSPAVVGSDGCYWTSSLITFLPVAAYHLYFKPIDMNAAVRSGGFSVRPVRQ